MDRMAEMTKQQDEMKEKLCLAQKAKEEKQRLAIQLEAEKKKSAEIAKDKDEALKECDSACNDAASLAKTEKDRKVFRCFFQIAIDEFEPLEKKPREDKSEFDLDGATKVPAKYTKMNISNLMGLSAVDPKCREYIVKNVFFEIKHLYKFDKVAFTQQHIAKAGGTALRR